MKYITPDYYDKFHCIADKCPDTCCAGWEITIDGQSMKKYQQYKGPFGNRLHNSIDWNEHTFLQYDHKCIFLNEENLCDMYTEAGAHILCQTCKQYPRHIESYLNVRELSIAISCPEMARMLLTREEKVHFLTKEIEKREEVDVVFQSELFVQLNLARTLMFDLLQNRSYDIKFRMGLVLGLGHDLQSRIYQRDYYNMSRLIEHYKKEETICRLVKKLQDNSVNRQEHQRYEMMQMLMKELQHLKVLNKEWSNFISNAYKTLYHLGKVTYETKYESFIQQNPSLSIQLEQLMVYFIYGYTNGSVYDGELYSKVKFAIVNTLLTEELFFAEWILKGYQLSLQQQIDIAHKFAREMEHLDENIEYFDKILREKKQYNLNHMLSV